MANLNQGKGYLKGALAGAVMLGATTFSGTATGEEPDRQQPQETITLAANDSFDSFSTAASGTVTPATPEQRARVAVDLRAHAYAGEQYGRVGVSVLKGPDTGDLSGERMAAGFENGFEEHFDVPASEGYSGDNGSKPTEVRFFRRVLTDNPNEVFVIVDGPYNFGDALEYMPQTATALQGTLKDLSQHNVSYEPDGLR